MKCSLIRDLMPVYDSCKCSKETEIMIQEHFKTCESCKSIFEDMHEGIGLKDSIKVRQELTEDNSDSEFWSKYYGTLIIKCLGVFVVIYIAAIIVRLYW
jgi:predicted anti-sigma-YlaC factor YlaD